MNVAYSKALAMESIPDQLKEKYGEAGQMFHQVTHGDLERFARIVAYKVAKNLANGLEMDPKGDPLTYVNCEDYPCLVPLEKVFSLDEAMKWFIKHCEGQVACVDLVNRRDKVCASYDEAKEFYGKCE